MTAAAARDEPLDGRVAIVTGASSGIGEATARALAAAGAAVTVAARRADRLERLVREIEAAGGRARAVAADVTDRVAMQGMARATLAAFGRIDILVNNAGVMPLSPVAKLRVDEWDRMLDVNVRGLLYAVAAVLPVMLQQGGGHIVNVGSVAGRRPFFGGTVYSATKFAVRAISAGLREELSPHHHIRVSDIEPGVVDTELADGITDAEMREAFAERWGDRTKLTSADVARAIRYVVTQPEHVNVNEVLVRPTQQAT